MQKQAVFLSHNLVELTNLQIGPLQLFLSLLVFLNDLSNICAVYFFSQAQLPFVLFPLLQQLLVIVFALFAQAAGLLLQLAYLSFQLFDQTVFKRQ